MKTTFTLLTLVSVLLLACSVTVDPTETDLTENEPDVETETTEATDERIAEFTLGTCIQDIYTEDGMLYNSWEAIFTRLFPELNVYDAGATCQLSALDKEYNLTTYSYSGDETNNQMVVLFDSEGNMERNAEFKCETLGDLGYAKITELEGNTVSLTCKSGDAGKLQEENFELDLESFTVSSL